MYLIIGYDQNVIDNLNFIADLASANKTTIGVYSPYADEDSDIPCKVLSFNTEITYEAVFVVSSSGIPDFTNSIFNTLSSNLWVSMEELNDVFEYPDDIIYLVHQDTFSYMGSEDPVVMDRLTDMLRKLVDRTHKIHRTNLMRAANVTVMYSRLKNMFNEFIINSKKTYKDDFTSMREIFIDYLNQNSLNNILK